MKKVCIQSVLGIVLLLSFACESNKKSTITEEGTEIVKARTPIADTINKEAIPEKKSIAVSGVVNDINPGKDGYTAKIFSGSNIYYATVSHSNLQDPAQFESVVKGDSITVSGDYWKLGQDEQITVRELKVP